MIRILILLALSLSIWSCRNNTYTLSESDLEWQPYDEGDTLVFLGDSGQQDTIIITNVTSHSNPDDHLSPLPNYHQTIFVEGKITSRYPTISTMGDSIKWRHINLLRMSAGKEYSGLYLILDIPQDSLNFPNTMINIHELDSLDSFFKNEGRFTIEAIEHYDNLPKVHDLKSYTWSKQFGYLEYELKEGEKYRLTSFLRAGKESLKLQ